MLLNPTDFCAHSHFLLMLPAQYREPIRHRWTRGIGELSLGLIGFAGGTQPTRIPLTGDHPLAELVALIAKRLGPKISGLPDLLNPRVKPSIDLAEPMLDFEDFERAVSTMTALDQRGFVRFLPSVTVLRLNHRGERRVYSLVANRVYASQWTLVFQNGQARPEEDTLSVYPTLVNGFPNLFVDLDLDRAPDFLRDLAAVETDGAWRRFQDRHAIARNSDQFWPFYDWLNDWNFEKRGADAGWLDLSYYDAPEI